MLSHYGMGVGEEVVTDRCSRIADNVCQQHRVSTDSYILTDHHVWPNVSVFADLGRWMNYRRGVDARRIFRRLIEKFDRLGKGEIRVAAAQHGGRNMGEIFGHNDRPRLCTSRSRRILWIGYEGEV